jgi:DNA-binding response OmpR family regulator
LRALEAGATDFLNSPVDHQEFVTRARNLNSRSS